MTEISETLNAAVQRLDDLSLDIESPELSAVIEELSVVAVRVENLENRLENKDKNASQGDRAHQMLQRIMEMLAREGYQHQFDRERLLAEESYRQYASYGTVTWRLSSKNNPLIALSGI